MIPPLSVTPSAPIMTMSTCSMMYPTDASSISVASIPAATSCLCICSLVNNKQIVLLLVENRMNNVCSIRYCLDKSGKSMRDDNPSQNRKIHSYITNRIEIQFRFEGISCLPTVVWRRHCDKHFKSFIVFSCLQHCL